LGWFVEIDLRLAPQHLMNGGLEPQVRPRNISGRQIIARIRQGDGVEAARSNAHSLWLFLRLSVAYQQSLLTNSAFKYFPNRRIFEFEGRGGAWHAGARGALISWLESDKKRLFYAQ
jgi:hypothetical protein